MKKAVVTFMITGVLTFFQVAQAAEDFATMGAPVAADQLSVILGKSLKSLPMEKQLDVEIANETLRSELGKYYNAVLVHMAKRTPAQKFKFMLAAGPASADLYKAYLARYPSR